MAETRNNNARRGCEHSSGNDTVRLEKRLLNTTPNVKILVVHDWHDGDLHDIQYCTVANYFGYVTAMDTGKRKLGN